MKKQQLSQYIAQLLNESTLNLKIIYEIPNVSLAIISYMAGLKGKEFPYNNLLEEVDIEKEIPAQFHTLVAQCAIIKSKKGNDYIYKNIIKLLKELRRSYYSN